MSCVLLEDRMPSGFQVICHTFLLVGVVVEYNIVCPKCMRASAYGWLRSMYCCNVVVLMFVFVNEVAWI